MFDPKLLSQLEDEDAIPVDVLPQLEDEDPPKEPTVQEPPAEFEHTHIDAFDTTVATPKGLPPEDRDKLIADFVSQQYQDPYEEQAGEEGQSKPIDIKGPGPEPTPTVPGSSLEDTFKRLLDMGGAQDNVPTPTAVSKETNTAMALSYVPRRVAGHMEKAAWAVYEGGLRAERALYQYAPNRLMDTFIKGDMKEARVGRLNRQIDYWMKPEKYGWVSPQVDEDKRLNDETAFRVNTYYGYANVLAEAGIDFTSFVAELGMMPGAGMAATEYAGKALPYLAKNAAHAVATMAPYALATTSGGIFPRLHSALILTAFGLVKPIVNLTGFRKLTATGIAAILNSALTHQDIMAAYKENGGFNQKFFKVFVPWIVMNVGFAVYLKDTPVAQKKQVEAKFIKAVVQDTGASFESARYVLKETKKQVEKADKTPEPVTEVSGEAKANIRVDPEVSSQSAAGVTEPTTPEAALPPKHVDYKIPDKVLDGPVGRTGSKKKEIYPEWKNANTRDGLLALKSDLSELVKSSFAPRRDVEGSVVSPERLQVEGDSLEHLRALQPRKLHKGHKSDLDLTKDALDGKSMTQTQHDRLVDLLKAVEDHDNKRMQEGQDYYEGKSSERPVDPDVNEELIKEQQRLEEEERLAIQEENQPDIINMTKAEYEAYQNKRKSVGAAGEEVTGEIPLPDLPNEVEVITLDGTKKTIRPKEDEAFSIVPIKGADGKVRYQLHDGQVYDIAVSEANKLMEYAGVKKKNAEARSAKAIGEHFKKNPIKDVSLKFEDYSSKEVELADITAKNPGGGQGSIAMKKIIDYADEKGINLMIIPRSGAVERLTEFYQRFGFVEDGDVMRRLARRNQSVGAKGLKPGEGNENNPHYQAVKKALEAGKTVRPEVLADYPDLQKKYGPKTPEEKQQRPTPEPGVADRIPMDSQMRESEFARKIADEYKSAKDTNIEKVAEYYFFKKEEQSSLAKSEFERNPEFAWKVASGDAEMPEGSGLYGFSVYAEAINRLKMKLEKNPGELALKLARSKYAKQASQAASTMSALSHLVDRDELDPIRVLNEVQRSREEKPSLELKVMEEKLKKAEERAAKAERAASERASSEPKEKFGAKNKIVTSKMKDDAVARFKAKTMGLRSNVDPTAMIEAVEIGTFYAEGGIREFKTWSQKMVTELGETVRPYLEGAWKQVQDKLQKDVVEKAKKQIQEIVTQEGELSDLTGYLKKINEYVQSTGVKGQENILNEVYKIVQEVAPKMTKSEVRDAISGYGKYRLLSKDELKAQIRDVSGQWQQLAKLEALEKQLAPLKTGAERRTPTDAERALIKQVNELKKKYNIQTTDPATQLKSSLDAIKTRLNNQIADLDREISTREKIVKTTTPPPSDAEVVALRKTRDTLKAERDRIFVEPRTDAQRIAAATKAAEQTVAELERRINEGDLSPEGKTVSVWSPEISRLKQQAGDLRDQILILKEMENPSLTPEQRAINAQKIRLERTEKSLKERIAGLDFEAKKKSPSVSTPEIDSLRAVVNAARKAQNIGVAEADELVRLSTLATGKRAAVAETSPAGSPERLEYGRAKSDFLDYADNLRHKTEQLKFSDFKIAPVRATLKALGEIPGLMKASVAGLDNSSVLNQGFKVGLHNPKIWGRNALKTFVDIYGTFTGKKMMREVRADIFSRPNYMNGVYKEHKLYFGNEEAFPTSILGKLPLLGKLYESSETAYTGFIWRNRADIFDNLYANAKKNSLDTKGLGELVNSITGRGNMGSLEKNADFINVVLFSGRYLKSNIDMLTGHASAWGRNSMSSDVKKIAARNTVVAYAALVAQAYLAAMITSAFSGEDFENPDPRSSSTLKTKIGNTAADLTGGASTIVRLAAQMIGGVKNPRTGIITPTWGDDKVFVTAGDLLWRFISAKFSPFSALGRDFVNNMKDFEGEPLGAESVSRVTPITPSSVVEGFVASEGNLPQKAAKTVIIAAASAVGGGIKSKSETADQMVKDANSIEKELARMDKVGDVQGRADLEGSPKVQRIMSLAGKGSDLRRLQEDINDTKTKIKDARNDMRTDSDTKKTTVSILEEELKSKQEYIDAYFNEIK